MHQGKTELLDVAGSSQPGSGLPSPSFSRPRNAAGRAIDGTLEGVGRLLERLSHPESRHDATSDLLRRITAFAKLPTSDDGDSEDLLVQDLRHLASADEPLVRLILPQLVAIAVRRHPVLSRLDGFLVTQSSASHDFAMECCWALLAERTPSDPPVLARAEGLLVSVERAGRLSQLGASSLGSNLRRTLSLPSAYAPVKRSSEAMLRGERPGTHGSIALPGQTTLSLPTASAEPSGGGSGQREAGYSRLLLAAVRPEEITELKLLHLLTGVATRLKTVTKSRRTKALQLALQQLDIRLQTQVSPCTWHMTPLLGRNAQGQSVESLRIVRICAADAHAFSTKERVPFIFYLEVLSSTDSEGLQSPQSRDRASSVAQPGGAGLLANRFKLFAGLGTPARLLASRRGSTGSSSNRRNSSSHSTHVTSPHVTHSTHMHGVMAPDPAAETAAKDVISEEHDALDSLSSRQVILQDLPREISGSEISEDFVEQEQASAPGHIIFGEPFETRQARLAQSSPHAAWPSWHVLAVVVKANDELRQEQFAMQLISTFEHIFARARLPLALRPYRIVATGPDCGLMEGITDAISLDALKQRTPHCPSLSEFFKLHFGGNRRAAYHRARLHFARSAAAYSIVCYLLQVKDRHNGNIMLTSDGHLVHIDFGYLLSNSPGGNMNFESAPFKLTNEYVELLGGTNSPLFRYFRYLLVRGFVEARRHRGKILQIVQTTLDFGGARWPCFRAGQASVNALQQRFQPDMTATQYTNHVINLINDAQGNFRTRCYDGYQYCCQGIA
mmetsp:Transcript_22479/g.57045  ORF Transcript_22479/g.57045 Transcript_22479/m.57045 type:complete len:787 (+) Transcript_22479:66-2426(+)|eukprot:CAMPEP_0179955162 /NCGR_PEP_ID=MMETSP0983-20121128/25971_1 /TAXON_ID=483367 /ORGANISM="non described non described, Strain CCMP 2436" /LENGTH=786 /DNA_ID=CAMNT_0021866449 /DNA_START=42 /DNA_END=2402 /DNA_ORIENTATION=-